MSDGSFGLIRSGVMRRNWAVWGCAFTSQLRISSSPPFPIIFITTLCLISYLFIISTLYSHLSSFFFFFNDTATTEIYTLSLHDALPFFLEEHTSQLQSHSDLVCRLLL